MKLAKISLAVVISVILTALLCPSVQAEEDDATVDLTAKTPSYQITDLAAGNPTRYSIDLTWTTPAVEVRPFSYFDVRYSRTIITTDNWDEATRATGEPTPAADASQGMTVTGLSSGTRYYFAIQVVDETGFVGILSNIASATTLAPPAAGGGGPAPPPPGTTDVRGIVSTEGVFLRPVPAISEDGLCTLTIPAGTAGLTEDLEPLTEITMLIMDDPPPPPEEGHVIGLAYDFQPSGATFEPPITLTFIYDPANIPEGVAEEDLVLAFYIEGIPPEPGEWIELEGCVVDPVTHTITASVSHFTTFAIIGAVPPPPPALAAFSLSNLTVQPAEVQPREAVTIAVSVANTGGTEGSYIAVLKIDGVKETEKSVTIAAGGSQTVTFSVTKEDAASYSVTVDGLSSSFTVVAPPAPAAFSVSNLSIQPTEVPTGEVVTIEVALTNTGGTHGSYTVVLKINGVKEADRTVTIDAGDTLNIIFPVTKEDAASYSVAVDGLSGTFVIVAPAVVTNWPMVGGIIAAVVVAGLVSFFLIRRKAH